jgi:nonsense-mediated mRNA decay protein 3
VKRSICPKCGQPSKEGLCDKCCLESTTFLSCPHRIELTFCPVCGSQLSHGKWQPVDCAHEELILEAVENAVGVHSSLNNPKLTLSLSQRSPRNYFIDVLVNGDFRGLVAEEQYRIMVQLLHTTCDRCSRMAGKYYQAVVQLRAQDRSPSSLEIDAAKEISLLLAKRSHKKGDQFGFVQDIKFARGGIDIIVGSVQLGRLIAKGIIERFGGATKESHKVVGRKDGKDIYRTNISVRLPRLSKGDIIFFDSSILEIKGFDGRNTICMVLDDGSRRILGEDAAGDAEVLGKRAEAKMAVIVAMDEDIVEILDPWSFKTVFATRPKSFDAKIGGEVEVIRSDSGFVLLS